MYIYVRCIFTLQILNVSNLKKHDRCELKVSHSNLGYSKQRDVNPLAPWKTTLNPNLLDKDNIQNFKFYILAAAIVMGGRGACMHTRILS